jgi:hypothetical protein
VLNERWGNVMGFSIDNIALVIIAVVLLYITVKFIKGLVKGIITMILILTLGVSAYNIFITQKPISYEIDRYKTDYSYFKEISSISSDAVKAIDEIKEGKNIKENINKLVQLRTKAEKIKHSEEIDVIHENYMRTMDTAIISAKGYENAKNAKEQLDKLNDAAKALDIDLKDILISKGNTQ